MTDHLLNSALTYASQGWAIHPLRPGDKLPLLKAWPDRATTDPATIRAWWQRWPAANIGLACGASGLVVVDLDKKDGRDGIASWACLGVNSQTTTSKTPSGGRHLIYKAPQDATIGNSAGKLGEGIDVRGDGGYIVLPPSRLGNGAAYSWEARPTDTPAAPLPLILIPILATSNKEQPSTPLPPPGQVDAYAGAALQRELDELARTTEGNRNHRLNEAAYNLGQLVGARALDQSTVESQLEAVARAIGLGEREAQATIRSGMDAGMANPRQIPEPRRPVTQQPPPVATNSPAEPQPIDGFHLTDLGNAERLKASYGDKLRWCDPWGSWLTWDEQRWRQDDTRTVDRWASEVVRGIYLAAHNEPDPDRRSALGAWAHKSESHHRRQAMVSSTKPFLAILPEHLDADPWLLTCNNGTINLKTGKLQPHDPVDLITKMVPVHYDPNAKAPTWMAFLDRIMAGNQDLIDFLQRAAGYSLTGLTTEQVFFILYGSGANGKSTFLEALGDMLDDYSRKTPTQTVLVRRSEGVSEDIARLKGARLVTAVEAEEGQRLAESLVKELVGGDTIAARHLYGKTFEFKPEFKLWLGTNHKPSIRGTDLAIWRRIRLVPFTVTIPEAEQDENLPDKLRAELPGILAWAVQGCLEWQRQGLGAPKEVKEATAGYQAEMDILGAWLDDCCQMGPTSTARAGDLYQSYKTWCDENGERAISGRKFSQRLQERGFDKYRDARGMNYIGLGIVVDMQDPYPDM